MFARPGSKKPKGGNNVRAGIELRTNIPDLKIDYIELEDADGKRYNISRDRTDYDNENGRYTAEWRGVVINDDEHVRLRDLPKCKIAAVGVYWEADVRDPFIRKMRLDLDDDWRLPVVQASYSIADVMPVADHT